jgi:uncharacterized protein (UPF0333 family)
MKARKLNFKKGQALLEYALLTSITVMIGVGLSYYYSQDYWQKVYEAYADIIAQPIPMD